MTYIVVKHDITLNVDILKFIIWKKKQMDFPMISTGWLNAILRTLHDDVIK